MNFQPLLGRASRSAYGGLPPALLADEKSPALYQEWLDSFFARDIERLFGVRGPERFTALFEYLLRQSGGSRSELVRAPKVYGFDTGFVSFFRGWDWLRTEDSGALWEHLVLEWLQAKMPEARIQYWRDKSGREVDFVIPRGGDRVDAFECKWRVGDFSPEALAALRKLHPEGANYIVTPLAGEPYERRFRDLEVTVCNPAGLR